VPGSERWEAEVSEKRGDIFFAFFCMSMFTSLFGAVTCLKFQDCPIRVTYLLLYVALPYNYLEMLLVLSASHMIVIC
jgi:hypothetical protein